MFSDSRLLRRRVQSEGAWLSEVVWPGQLVSLKLPLTKSCREADKTLQKHCQRSAKLLSKLLPQTLPNLCQKYAKTLTKLWQIYAKTLPKLYQNSAKTLPKLCQNSAKTLPQLCQNSAKTLPKLCQNSAKTLPKLCQNSAKNLSNLCQNCQNFAKTQLSRVVWPGQLVSLKVHIINLCRALHDIKLCQKSAQTLPNLCQIFAKTLTKSDKALSTFCHTKKEYFPNLLEGIYRTRAIITRGL